MRLFGRRPPDIPADVGGGFWVSETRALQRALVGVLTGAERAERRTTTTQLEFSPGAEGNVVVLWRNAIVGFVPPARTEPLRRQLRDIGKATLVSDGHALDDGNLWRIWVGQGEPDSPPPGPEADQIPPAPNTIFGIALRDRRAKASRPRETTTAPPQLLTIDAESWDVRDGTDIDLALLRRRIAAAAPGDTLHLRIWDQTVTVRLTPDTQVTLTDPTTGQIEPLHPR